MTKLEQQRNDALRAVIENSVELIFTVAMLLVARKLLQPDFALQCRMKVALVAKRTAQSQADTWQKIADNAGTVYQKARL